MKADNISWHDHSLLIDPNLLDRDLLIKESEWGNVIADEVEYILSQNFSVKRYIHLLNLSIIREMDDITKSSILGKRKLYIRNKKLNKIKLKMVDFEMLFSHKGHPKELKDLK